MDIFTSPPSDHAPSNRAGATGRAWYRVRCLAMAAALVFATACNVEEAPEDLDGLFHWFWTHYDEEFADDIVTEYDGGSDEEIALAVINAHEVIDGDHLAEAETGALSDFSRGEMDLVSMRSTADPDDPDGMYVINAFVCSLDELRAILARQDQDQLYEGEYDTYDRTYTSDYDDFASGESSTLAWKVEMEAEWMAGASYTEVLRGGLRWVPEIDEDTTPWGPVLMARTWLPQAADFENDDFYFDQDYQIEVFWERSPNQIVHLYGLWREAGFLDASTDDDTIVHHMTEALAEWDDTTAEICASGDYSL
jgi:hypothetical protein